MSIEKLNNKHPIRQNYLKRWNFLYDSYLGGKEYRDGEYLHTYWGEQDAPFDAYKKRLDSTPLDNHVKTTVDIYRSYIWKNPPSRQYGPLENNPFVESFVKDADLNGQSIDSYLKNALDWAMVLGQVWILVDKPAYYAESAAEELEMGYRPYLCMYTPQNVLDWNYETNPNGSKYLSYVKTLEYSSKDEALLKEWYPEFVIVTTVEIDETTGEYTGIKSQQEYINTLGKVPFITLMPNPMPGYECGVSILGDVADIQRSIYNKLSELEQNIRISNHPVLVKTPQATAEAGAGAIISIPDDLDPGHKPYLLQPSGASIDSIIKAIEHDVESINTMTHLTAVRAQKTAMSGVALQTERQLLNAKLGDLSDTINEVETKIWALWCDWMDLNNTVEVEYSHHFDTRDPQLAQEIIKHSLEIIQNPVYKEWAEKEIVKLIVRDEEEMNQLLAAMEATPVEPFQPHTMYDAEGNEYIANSQEDHERYVALGYTHG